MLQSTGQSRGSILVLLCIVIPVLIQGCSDKGLKEVPNHLTGKWEADEPRYKGRYLVFTPDTVTFGTGGDIFIQNDIKKIEYEATNGGGVSYTLNCINSYGEKNQLTISYDSKNGGSIKVGHIQATWWKVEE